MCICVFVCAHSFPTLSIWECIYNFSAKVFPDCPVSKESACNAGDTGNVDLIPEWEWSHGGGNGNPFQYSCLENLMDRGDSRLQSMGLQRGRQDWVTEHYKKEKVSICQESFFNWFVFNWRMITLQYCIGFCPTPTWISHCIHMFAGIYFHEALCSALTH